jgi:four helix bundle protein
MGMGFEDLEVYQQARILRTRVYRLTKLLPKEEKYILLSQMRRTALSVTNCIAEGHGSRSYRHNRSYLFRSRGSVCELQDDFNTCEDEEYFKKEHLNDLRKQAQRVLMLINGYVAFLDTKIREEFAKGQHA